MVNKAPLSQRVLEIPLAVERVKKAQSEGLIVGMCHGCFDILHFGHLRHFESAASLCDLLLVSITADQYVNKGPDRPLFSHNHRTELISALYCVEFTVVSDSPSAHFMLETLKPNRYFKGSDYLSDGPNVNPNFKEERDFAINLGIEVLHTDEDTSSSSKIFKKIAI